MSERDIINITALAMAIIIVIAIQVTILLFEITNLKDKINDLMYLMFKLDRKLANSTGVKSEVPDEDNN